MISIFGNVPLKLSAEAATNQLPSPPARVSSQEVVARAVSAAPTPKRGFKWFQIGRARKRLQMVETVSLGEKRFVALVQVDGRQFLIGGAPSNVGMLAELAPEESFHQVLKEATQGLDTPVATSAPAVSQPAVSSPEPLATAAVATLPAVAAVAIQEPIPAVLSMKAPEARQPSSDPADLVLEDPVTFSSSLLAAMQASTKNFELPEAQVPAEIKTPHVEPLVPVAIQEAITPESIQTTPALPFVAAPKFTFQVSHLLNLGSKAAPRQVAQKNDPEAARRIAAAWMLQGATS